MPRGPRLDSPGALHHVIARGIERRPIFLSDDDRLDFLQRLGALVLETKAALYAWALLPNHTHALIRTGKLPLSQLMHRLLTGYVRSFNPRHHRCGHLFQNRFKNTLVEEEPYLLELVRYIHLNPVRSRLPVTLESLDLYRWTGHAVLLGHRKFPAQDVDFVLSHFGHTTKEARRAYRQFILDGCDGENIPDLEGGGLRRSAGGWEFVRKLRRGREKWAFDERILGSTQFVHEVLENTPPECRPGPRPDPATLLHALCLRIAPLLGIGQCEIASASLRRDVLHARAIVSHLAVRHYGLSLSTVARQLGASRQSIARDLVRAPSVLAKHRWPDADFLLD